MASENLKESARQALLAEYQVCQEDNSANFQGFWSLAAIFFGLSSVFLAGLIYAVIANESLFSIMLYHNEPKKVLVVGIIALIIGIANVFILENLKGWRRRVMFNQGLNLGRMREIELDLNLEMYRAWQIQAINTWHDMLETDKEKKTASADQKWDSLKSKLGEGLDEESLKKLDERKDKILELLKRYFTEEGKVRSRHDKFEPSSSKKHFPFIQNTLLALWGLVIGAALFAIGYLYLELLWAVIIGVVAFAIVVLWDKLVGLLHFIRDLSKRRSKA